jgi:hypothetical protein
MVLPTIALGNVRHVVWTLTPVIEPQAYAMVALAIEFDELNGSMGFGDSRYRRVVCR